MSKEKTVPVEELSSLKMRLIGLLLSYEIGHYKPYYFDTGTLSVSLTRLFETYHRIVVPLFLAQKGIIPFMEGDVEHFMIRYRVVLNDLGYILRQIYPKHERGMPAPGGGVKERNKEMSIAALISFTEKYPDRYPKLTALLYKNSQWILKLREERDDVIHYKKRVFIAYPEDTGPVMCVLNMKYDEAGATIKMPDGSSRLKSVGVFEYVHSQMRSLVDFMNIDLADFIFDHVTTHNHKLADGISVDGVTISCIGIPMFNQLNAQQATTSPSESK